LSVEQIENDGGSCYRFIFSTWFFVFELICGVLRALATSLWEEPKEGVLVVSTYGDES